MQNGEKMDALMDKRREKGILEYPGKDCNRGQSLSAGGPERKPQAALGIVKVGGRRQPDMIHRRPSGNRHVPYLYCDSDYTSVYIY